jgi:putative membrane protein
MEDAANTLPSTDVLAAARTMMASERTVLAYSRTALGVFVTGVGFLKYVEFPAVEIVAAIMMLGAMYLGIFGGRQYLHIRRLFRGLTSKDLAKLRDVF